MVLEVPGEGRERLGAEEWPWVERASCGSGAGLVEEELGCWAGVGSSLGSGSGGGGIAADDPDEDTAPDVLIASAGLREGARSFRFLSAVLAGPGRSFSFPFAARTR